MKYLITGGAGFIGSHIAEELINKGIKPQEIIIFDNLSVGKRENVPKDCKLVVKDIKDKDALKKAMKEVDVVFHNAAFVSIRASFGKLRQEVEDNCLGTLNVLETAVQAKVKKFIFASSMAAYGKPRYFPIDEKHPLFPISPYGLSKARGEMYCKIFHETGKIKTVVLRYNNAFGVKQTPSDYVGVTTTFINQALQNKPLTVYGEGKQTRDFVWVKDLARANVLAAFLDVKGTFNIGSGTEISVNEVAEAIMKHTRAKKVYMNAPPGEIPRVKMSIEKAEKLLGYKPQGSIIKMMPELIEWWKKKTKR